MAFLHGFCNCRVGKNKINISVIAHNLLQFDQYESIDKFYMLMRMRRRPQYFVQFSENYHFLQNFWVENKLLNEKFNTNPQKCNSASSFSSCVHRGKSKVIIALPAEAETVRLFEKPLVGEFSGVNRRH